jgi:hypothetical protein
LNAFDDADGLRADLAVADGLKLAAPPDVAAPPFVVGASRAYADSIVGMIHLTGPCSRSTTTLARDVARGERFAFARVDALRTFGVLLFVGMWFS